MGADRQEQVCIPVPPKRRLALRRSSTPCIGRGRVPLTVSHRALNIVADIQIGLCVPPPPRPQSRSATFTWHCAGARRNHPPKPTTSPDVAPPERHLFTDGVRVQIGNRVLNVSTFKFGHPGGEKVFKRGGFGGGRGRQGCREKEELRSCFDLQARSLPRPLTAAPSSRLHRNSHRRPGSLGDPGR